jgi:hypothetical protein
MDQWGPAGWGAASHSLPASVMGRRGLEVRGRGSEVRSFGFRRHYAPLLFIVTGSLCRLDHSIIDAI